MKSVIKKMLKWIISLVVYYKLYFGIYEILELYVLSLPLEFWSIASIICIFVFLLTVVPGTIVVYRLLGRFVVWIKELL